MHRYREFGVESQEDERFRRAFRDGFKSVGLSFAQFLDALAWYRDHGRAVAGEAGLTEAFTRFAADRNWTAEHRDGIVALYRNIRDDGAAAATQTPSPEQDQAALARADQLLRTDPARYWGDGEFQDAVFEARERLRDHPPANGVGQTEGRPSQDRQRVAEIEGLLRDPTGDGQRRYWNDPGLRAGYSEALARLQSGTDESSPVAPRARTEPGLDHTPNGGDSTAGDAAHE